MWKRLYPCKFSMTWFWNFDFRFQGIPDTPIPILWNSRLKSKDGTDVPILEIWIYYKYNVLTQILYQWQTFDTNAKFTLLCERYSMKTHGFLYLFVQIFFYNIFMFLNILHKSPSTNELLTRLSFGKRKQMWGKDFSKLFAIKL